MDAYEMVENYPNYFRYRIDGKIYGNLKSAIVPLLIAGFTPEESAEYIENLPIKRMSLKNYSI